MDRYMHKLTGRMYVVTGEAYIRRVRNGWDDAIICRPEDADTSFVWEKGQFLAEHEAVKGEQ